MSKKTQEMLTKHYLITAWRLAAKPEGERVMAIFEALCKAHADGRCRWADGAMDMMAELGEGEL